MSLVTMVGLKPTTIDDIMKPLSTMRDKLSEHATAAFLKREGAMQKIESLELEILDLQSEEKRARDVVAKLDALLS